MSYEHCRTLHKSVKLCNMYFFVSESSGVTLLMCIKFLFHSVIGSKVSFRIFGWFLERVLAFLEISCCLSLQIPLLGSSSQFPILWHLQLLFLLHSALCQRWTRALFIPQSLLSHSVYAEEAYELEGRYNTDTKPTSNLVSEFIIPKVPIPFLSQVISYWPLPP